MDGGFRITGSILHDGINYNKFTGGSNIVQSDLIKVDSSKPDNCYTD